MGAAGELWSSNWPDTHARLVRVVALYVGSLALLRAWTEVERLDASVGRVSVWLLLLVVAGYVAAIGADRRPLLSTGLLIGGSLGAALAPAAAYGNPVGLGQLLAPALAAAFLVPHPGSWLVLLGIVACAWLAPVWGLAAPARLDVVAYVLAPGASVAVCLGGLQQELRRAWQHSNEAARLAEQVRARREEVNKLNKALQLSNYLLKRSNYELALARQEAEEARHAKERFATCVSHELRTPLNIILGFAEVMQRFPETYGEMSWPALLRQDVAEIQRSARYLSDLVDDVLDLARIQVLRMPIHREWVDLGELMQDAAALARRLVVGKPVQIDLELDEDVPQLFVDRTRVRQVLLNLLANASRFTEQGSIRMGVRAKDEEVEVYVSDTGPGIPTDQLDTIFDEFRQAGGEHLDSQQGSGLGLAIAQRFVQMHGGHIWVDSRLGEGSTFRFTLPLRSKQVSPSVLPDLHSPPASPDEPSLVVVDPDPRAAIYLHRWLDGFHVWAAADSAQAVNLVKEKQAVAVVLNLPPGTQAGDTVGADLNGTVPVIRCALPCGAWLVDDELFESWLVKPISTACLEEALGTGKPWSKVLVVDDDRAFVQLAARMLQALRPSCTVGWANSAQEALARVAAEGWDVLLLDIALPDMDGRHLAQMMRTACQGSAVRILAVSGLQPGEDQERLSGSSFYVTRPSGLREQEVLALLRATLQCLGPSPGDQQREPALREDRDGTPAW
ncbi:MAG: hybrid sensor histidine kinase/response regulator [Anaerolineae bacterium]|nr:hybrid sensor histidine kinase/response regulator [Anaerolineae bacterium]